MFINSGSEHVFESEFASGIKDVIFICCEWPFLIEFMGGFIMFSRGKEKRRECDQSIVTGDIPVHSSPKHSC